ncbi:IclR family transcriptional regulator [Salipaludibacillus neizhouensis]|uniref:IclR family transcriptional regulator n=1 Tax=Salipaludibacillus neizhouensis TaxID=885475 RepID=A0A3A9K296_9BACI|nr:IclR family transcriptional regulator [Salipaludibacillus neizhouensis]RKL65050.1 IclR family transcriptional regulator [Salipaludibacillus neizhouensis]
MVYKYWVPGIERANLVLNLIAREPNQYRLIDITKTIEINKSTLFSLLNTLETLGWIVKGKGDTYSLGPTLGSLGAAYFKQFNILQAFYLEAAKSVNVVNENIQLGILDGTDVVYLAKEEGKSQVRLLTDPGMRFPAHASAIGKIQLSKYSLEELNRLYPEKKLEQKTHKTICYLNELWDQLVKAKEQGYICEEQEGSLDFFCVGAPVYDHEAKIIAGVSFTMLENSWLKKKEVAIEEIKNLAQRLSNQAGAL